MFDKFLQNCRKPRGAGGWFLISTMNWGHGPVSRWGLKHLDIRPGDHILDAGCGAGKTWPGC
jgi:2-polyprenyl-3-methyl-5-hydroxy-6-metoxy-1,4-benzoquinol methylase